MPSLLGRWLHPSAKLLEITHLEGAKVLGKWRGEKGGPAGFAGRISKDEKSIRAIWYDDDAGVREFDGLVINIKLEADGQSFTATATKKDGGETTWVAKRELAPRTGGKLMSFTCKSKKTFNRLTAPRDEDAIEAARLDVLSMSIRETAVLHPSKLDGSTTYIPPLAVADKFDDSALRRHAQHSRHKGKQILCSTAVVGAGRSKQTSKAPPVTWIKDPYLDQATLYKTIRAQERARTASSLPPSLRERKAFKPTNCTEVAADVTGEGPVFVNTLVDVSLPYKTMRDMAHTAVSMTRAESGIFGDRLIRTTEGKLVVQPGPKNLVAGYPHWTDDLAYKTPTLDMPPEEGGGDKGEAKPPRLDIDAAAEEEKKLRFGRRAFTPSGPRLHRSKEQKAAEDAAAAAALAAMGGSGAAGGAASPRGKAAAAADKGDRPAYNPFGHYDPGKFSKYPEFMHENDPKLAGTASSATLRSKGKGEGGGDTEKPLFRPCTSPAKLSRLISSIATHPMNMLRSSSSGGLDLSGSMSSPVLPAITSPMRHASSSPLLASASASALSAGISAHLLSTSPKPRTAS